MSRNVFPSGALSILAMLGALACESGRGQDDAFSATGLIRDSRLGCWVLSGSAGGTYELTDLPAEFRVDSLAVRASLRRLNSQRSICMVGEIVEVLRVERLAEPAPAVGRMASGEEPR